MILRPGRYREPVITEQPTASIQPAVRALIATSLAAAVVGIVGAALRIGWVDYAQWLYVPPLAVALVLADGLRDRRGWWWLAGLVLSWLGDVLGGASFLVLLGCFLVAHGCYVMALLPTRRLSLLSSLGALPYLLLGLAGAVALVPAAGPVLAVPVAVYAATLTLMAVLATAGGRAGVVGGLLFMVSDLVLGIGTFVVDIPPGLQTLLVIGTYVPAQVLLLVGLLTRVLPPAEPGSDPTARTPGTDQPDPGT